MRDFKGMKRQRNRGRGGGGGKPQHNTNRAFDSNGPDGVKVRGAAQHIYEKYQQLARDAGSSGDRVLAENYLQHAEHYFRVLRAMQPQRPVGEIIGRDQFASGYDIDFEEEPPAAAEETAAADSESDGAAEARRDDRRDDRSWQRDDRQGRDEYRGRDDRQRDERPRDEYRQRDDRSRDDRQGGDYRSREDRPREDRPRDDRPRDDRPREDRPRDDRPREDRPRDERPRDDRYQGDRQGRFRDDRQGRYQGDRPPRQDRDYRAEPRAERDPLNVIEPQATPLAAAPTPAPTQEPVPETAGDVLRGEDGAMSHAPAFLQARTPDPRVEGEEGGERRPRRRRPPRSFEAGEAPSEADDG
jgi:hypothetical protein